MVFFKQDKWAWHNWFAWHPVKVESEREGKFKYVLFETVSRHLHSSGDWEYQQIRKANDITIHRG